MRSFDTVTEALADLKARGFTKDFNISFDKLSCAGTDLCLLPEDFEITEFYRFEGETNPSDEEIVYGISSKTTDMKGTLVSAFGVYAESVSTEMLRKLTIHTSPN